MPKGMAKGGSKPKNPFPKEQKTTLKASSKDYKDHLKPGVKATGK